MTIKILPPESFERLSYIWDIKKRKVLAEKCYSEAVGGNRIIFVAEENGKLIGEVDLVFDNGDTDYTIPHKRIYFSRLIVKKDRRKQGIGTALSEYVFGFAKEKGYSEMSLGVDIDNFSALKLYQKLGFDKLLFVGEDEQGKYVKLLKQL